MFRKVNTEQYPEDKDKYPPKPAFHGRHQLNRHPDGLEKCVGCELCAWACPADALSVAGAVIALLIFGKTLNIFSMIGLLLLMGIVKKNSILQIDHIKGLRREGMSRLDAIFQGCDDRLRPILMTTAALTVGGVSGAFNVTTGVIPLLDVDGNGQVDARTDGLILIRYMFDMRGPTLTGGAIGTGATRTAAEIETYIQSLSEMDVDGNGEVDALTDGLMLVRYMFGMRGATLTGGAIGTGATRTAAEIEAYIQSMMP